MTIFNTDTLLMQIPDALVRDDLDSAIQIFEALRPDDQALVFDDLTEADQVSLLSTLEPAVSADIVENLDEFSASELMVSLPKEDAIRIINKMAPDEAADLLGELPPDQAQRLLRELDEPEKLKSLPAYADDTAGWLMTSDCFVLCGSLTASMAIDAIRERGQELEDAYYLLVVDESRILQGVISLQSLIMAKPATRLDEIMDRDVISVYPDTDQEKCAWLMTRYDLVMLPVVDQSNKLLGVISVNEVVDVLVDEATEDIQRFGGAQPLEKPYLNTRVSKVAKTRIGWLLLLFVTESLTGTVLRHFEDELAAVVALSFFIPLLIGTGGNAGSQATSTIIRAMAVGELSFKDGFRAMWHEYRIGLLLGLGMSVFAYLRALTWRSEPGLALTVSVSIMAIVIWANTLGALLPLLATRLKIDPTVVSGPVMSTLVDATGLFIYFTLAHFILKI